MSRARDRASREGTSPVKIGTTQLNTDSGDLKVTDTSNNLKKVVADEIHIGDASNKVIIKKGSDNKVQFQTQASGQAATDSSTGGVTVYANVSAMSAASANAGDLAYVTATNKLYVHNGGGWYAFTSEVNTTPVISSPATGLSYKLASDGTATSLEITATDADPGTTLQYSYAVTTGSLGSTATVTSSATSGGTYSALAASTNTTNRFFKINPSTNSDHAGSFTLTFSASDSVNAATTAQSFSLSFDVSGSVFFYGGNDVVSNAGHSIISPVSNDLVIGTNDFTIEFWVWSDNFNAAGCIFDMRESHSTSLMLNTNGSGQFRFYANSGYRITSEAVSARTWNHVAIQKASNVTKMYVNGKEQSTSYSDSNNYTGNKVYLGTERDLSTGMHGYLSNYRQVVGSNAYTITTASGGSTSFDGTGDYLATPNSNNLQLGTGDFTIEYWIYPTAFGRMILSRRFSGATVDMTMNLNTDATVRFYANTGYRIVSDSAVNSNEWTHVALVRASGTTKMYVNGAVQSTTYSDSNNYAGDKFHIGAIEAANAAQFQGNISNFRVVKGTAVYTSNFTPPTTQLTAISNTQLLTCQNSTGSITDASSNNYTITANGNAAASTSKPFSNYFTVPTRQLTAITNTKLLALQGKTPKYETGGSAYMTSYSAAIKVDDAALEVGTGDFTIEFYYKFHSFNSPTSRYLFFDYNEIQLGISQGSGNNPTTIGLYKSGWAHGTSGVGLNLHQWYHIAVVRTGGYIKVYVDGVEIISTTNGATHDITDGKLTINGTWGSNLYGLNGGTYYSMVRHCSKAVYTGAFTPPRNINKTGGDYESTTNVSNPTAAQTELLMLLRASGGGVVVDESDNALSLTKTGTVTLAQYGVSSANLTDSSSFNHTLTQSGMPKGSYVSPFDQGSGSIEINDYTNSYIYVADDDIELGSGDFCIEYWFMDKGMYGLAQTYNQTYEYNGYFQFGSSSGTGAIPFPSSGAATGLTAFTLYHNKGSTNASGAKFDVSSINNSGNGWFQTTGNAIINPLTWYHMAIVRESNEIKLYFDGTRMPFASTYTNSVNYTFDRLAIGGGYAQYAIMNGYISNFRLVVGSPVYTGNFTVPTAALGAITNTKLLTAQHSNQIIDASGNCTIIPVNGCAATRLSPF